MDKRIKKIIEIIKNIHTDMIIKIKDHFLKKAYTNNDKLLKDVRKYLGIAGNPTSSQSQKYWIRRGWSEEDAEERRTKTNKKGKSVYSIQNWIKRGYTEEGAEFEIKSRRPSNKEYFIKKFNCSEEEAIEMVNEYQTKKWEKAKTHKKYWIKKGFSEDESIKKAREETLYKSVRCKEYWIKKGFSEKDSIEIVSKNQSRDYQFFIEKFGNKEGTLKYHQHNIQLVHSKKDFISLLIKKIRLLDNIFKEHVSFDFWFYNRLEVRLESYLYVWFNNNIENLYNEIPNKIKNLFKNNQKIFHHKSRKYFNMYTERGELLRSSHEINFYFLLKKYNINYLYEKKYPNSRMRYDFYLPKYNLYIEIAGMMNDKKYKEKMIKKHKMFGAVILKSRKEQKLFINNLVKQKNIKKENTLVDNINKILNVCMNKEN